MKKLLLTICALSALTFTAAAQANRTSGNPGAQQQAQTPEEIAEKETKMAIEALALNDTQKGQFKQLVLDKAKANKPLKEKMQAATTPEEKKAIRAQFNVNREKFFTSVNAILNPDQQTKWAEHKKQVEAKEKEANH